jgi:hypothetical protein
VSAEAKGEASLAEISRTTIAHYEDHPEQFWMSTPDHDVSQNIDALLSEMEGVAPFVRMAQGYAGVEVWG